MNEIIRPITEIIKPTSKEIAKEILGEENFLGQEAVKKTFGIELKPEEIAPIPFTAEELERVNKLNQQKNEKLHRLLILNCNKAPDGKPLSMNKMQKLLKTEFQKKNKGKILYDINWYETELFYTQDTAVRTAENYPTSWVLVSKDLIPNSTNKNYLEQTEVIIDYLKNEVFKNQTLPKKYQKAIEEFGKEKSTIKKLISADWKKAAEKLSLLKINQLTRQSPAEVLYDSLMLLENTGDRLLEDKYTWTCRRSSDGWLVDVGLFDHDGAYVSYWRPDLSNDYLGVLLQQFGNL